MGGDGHVRRSDRSRPGNSEWFSAGEQGVSPVLVARDDELAGLGAVVSATPAVMVVEGEAGVGKTRLVEELPAGSGVGGWAAGAGVGGVATGGAVEILSALGSSEPVVLVLENLHWTVERCGRRAAESDEHTIDFVSYLVADPPPRVALVVTYPK